MARTPVFTDNFDRADGAPANGWTAMVGGVAIATSVLRGTTADVDNAAYNSASLNAAQYAKASIGGGSDPLGALVRISSPGASYNAYGIGLPASGNAWTEIWKVTGGTIGVLKAVTSPPTWAAGDTFEIEVETVGSDAVIRIYRNGGQIDTYTDTSSPLASGSAGVVVNHTTALLDNFEAGNLGGGAALTFYCSNPMQSNSSAGLLNLSVPAASTSTTGWTVANTITNAYSRQTYGVEKASSTFTSIAQPAGAPLGRGQDCWRTSGTTTGAFSAGTWYSNVSVIAVSAGGNQDGNARFRLWRTSSDSILSATEITAGTMVGTTVTNLATTVAQTSSASTYIAGFSLTTEYLVMQVAWQRTGVGSTTARDVLIRLGNMAETSGSGVLTSTFSATGGAGAAAPKAGYFNQYYQWTVRD